MEILVNGQKVHNVSLMKGIIEKEYHVFGIHRDKETVKIEYRGLETIIVNESDLDRIPRIIGNSKESLFVVLAEENNIKEVYDILAKNDTVSLSGTAIEYRYNMKTKEFTSVPANKNAAIGDIWFSRVKHETNNPFDFISTILENSNNEFDDSLKLKDSLKEDTPEYDGWVHFIYFDNTLKQVEVKHIIGYAIFKHYIKLLEQKNVCEACFRDLRV